MKTDKTRQDFYGVTPVTTGTRLTKYLALIIIFILVLLPFHAFLTVWLSSAVGHYTLLRLWKEFLLIIAFLGVIYLLIVDKTLRKKLLSSIIVRLIGAYTLLTIIWGVVAWLTGAVTAKALAFGLVVNLRFLLFFILTLVVATLSQNLKLQNRDILPFLHSGFAKGRAKLRQFWPYVLLIPAAVVVLVGLIQRWFLPYDILKHFGYGPDTIYAYQTVNHDINYPRIMSTLRGANPLGAYLILILSAIAVLFVQAKKRRLLWAVFGFGTTLALVYSYSRAAWAGVAVSFLFLAWILAKKNLSKQILVAGLAVILIGGVATTLALRQNPAFERAFLHTDRYSQAQKSSNQEHISSFKSGFRDVAREPLGRGVGTAGPASVYNEGSRISENYFTQIGQELGWIGLALIVSINFLVARELWFRKNNSLALALLISFAGITLVNLVSHSWTDDTLAYIWWGLAGMALAPLRPAQRRSHAT